ncbi:MAG: lysophospholipid acyltransferase family protein [Candidatus Omnitrophota bacterium]
MLYHSFMFGRWLALKFPLKTGYKIAMLLADIYYIFARDDRKNLEENLRVVLETDDKKRVKPLIRNVFKNFAKYLVDFLRFSRLNSDYFLANISIEGKENIDKAMAGGKGAILLTAHIGNWELAGAIIARFGYPVYAIALDHADKRLNDFFLEQRMRAGVKIIPIGAHLKSCFRVLKNNGLLGILGDRDFSNHGIKANFFGKETILPKGPAFFSLRTGAPIIPLSVVRVENDAFRVFFHEPLESVNTGDNEDDIKRFIKRYISVIEGYIRSYPDQWYAFRKVWD